jgi:hypothetical protein
MYRIGIMGKANSGKNTLGRVLTRELRNHIYETENRYMHTKYMAFADPMKEMIGTMYPSLPRKFLYGSSKYRDEIIPESYKDGKRLTIRQLLIDLGTSGRDYDPDIWIKNLDKRYHHRSVGFASAVIITDIRFRNEFDYLRKNDFYLIRLYRNSGLPGIQHVSETGQNAVADDEFDCIVHNDKSLKELKLEVSQRIIPKLRSK